MQLVDHHPHHPHHGGGGSNAAAAVIERFSALDSALHVTTALCLADPDGRAFKTLWRDDLRATLVRAAYLEPDVARIFGAGRRSAINAAFKSLAITRQLIPPQRKRGGGGGGGGGGGSSSSISNNANINRGVNFKRETDKQSTSASISSRLGSGATIWKTDEADAVRIRALALIRRVNASLETLQTGIGSRIDPNATARSLLVSRSGDVIRLLRSMRIEPKQSILGAYVRTVVLGGQPHLLRQALSLVSERPSGAAASHISDVLRSACTPQFASAVYSLLPELTAVGIRPSGDVLGELIEAATKAWVAGQVYSCPHCLELIGTQNSPTGSIVTRSLQYEAKRSSTPFQKQGVIQQGSKQSKQSAIKNEIHLENENQQVYTSVKIDTGSMEDPADFIDVLPSKSNTTPSPLSSTPLPPSSSSPSSSSSSYSKIEATLSTTNTSSRVKSGLGSTSTPPWALEGAKPSASALAAISNASVRCIAGQSSNFSSSSSSIGGDSTSSSLSSSFTLFPSRQLAVLSATGLLGSVPESALVQLAQAAANSLCGREAWTVWQHMRHLKLHAAHLDRGLLRQLTLSFIAGRLQLPAWEAYLVLYPRPASKLTLLPSLDAISALVEAEAASELLPQTNPQTQSQSQSQTLSKQQFSIPFNSEHSSPSSLAVKPVKVVNDLIDSEKKVVDEINTQESKSLSSLQISQTDGIITSTVLPINSSDNHLQSTTQTTQTQPKRRYVPHHFRAKCTQKTILTDAEILAIAHIAVPVSQGRYFRVIKPLCIANISKHMLMQQADFERVASDIQKALIVGARQSIKAGLEHILVTGASLVVIIGEKSHTTATTLTASHSIPSTLAIEKGITSNTENILSVAIFPAIPAWIDGKQIIPGKEDFLRILDEANDRLLSSGSLRIKLPPLGIGSKDESWRVDRITFQTC
jgi:hypothetical protein